MLTNSLAIRAAKLLVAVALLALLSGCATCDKPDVVANGGTKSGDPENGIELNAPGPHQFPCEWKVDKGVATLKIPVYTGADDLGTTRRKGIGHKNYVKFTIRADRHNPRHAFPEPPELITND